jgi:CheY-like chemotaxis protein/anti-sigma regulatory factor (Ser/Thr protein kinase)
LPQRRGIVIAAKAELARGIPAIMGVESEIRDSLVNLVFNAVDAMPAGGTLTLTTRVSGTRAAPLVQIEVADTGVGMDAETRSRCLEPFFTTKGERGTGLGLAMVYGMVQRHSAEIEIESAPGKGTRIRLNFASAPGAEPTPPPAPTTTRHGKGLALLVIDDDPLVLRSLCDALEADGHVVAAANGGQSGIDAFRAAVQNQRCFAAVITDLGMPHVDGRKVAAEIKATSPETPVILLTGWGQRLATDGDVPAHVDQVLAKPPTLRDLRDALARYQANAPA